MFLKEFLEDTITNGEKAIAQGPRAMMQHIQATSETAKDALKQEIYKDNSDVKPYVERMIKQYKKHLAAPKKQVGNRKREELRHKLEVYEEILAFIIQNE